MYLKILLIVIFVGISLTILAPTVVANTPNAVSAKRRETMNTLMREAGCRNGGILLAKGACIESDYDQESPENPIYQLISFTFTYYRMFAINEKEKKILVLV